MPMDLNQAALKLALAAESMPTRINELLEKSAQIVEDEAKAEIGHYQPGWPRLKAWTRVTNSRATRSRRTVTRRTV
jgi:hypothetical protein